MPKQDGRLETCVLSIEVYIDNGETSFVSNDIFKKKIQQKIRNIGKPGAKLDDGPALLKKNEIARYFGLIDYSFDEKKGRVNKYGIDFYKNINQRKQIIFDRMKEISFGINNPAIKNSDSYINPPILFLKLINEFKSLNKNEFAYILHLIEDKKIEYETAVKKVIKIKKINLNFLNKNKYLDCKFPIFFKDLGIISEKNKRFFLNDDFTNEIDQLKIFSDERKSVLNVLQKSLNILPKNEDILWASNNRKPEKTSNNKRTIYKTDQNLKSKVFHDCNFKCEIDASHITFQKENDEIFMEGHHLIPMKAQDDFEINIDRIENIVCLCPNCHRMIHHAKKSQKIEIFKKLYEKKSKGLVNSGLKISAEEIFNKYY